MGLDLPTVGVTAGPTYASKNNAAFEAIDDHDHSSGNGVQIPTAGINIDADISVNGFEIHDVDVVEFDGRLIASQVNRSIYFLSTNGEFYVRDGAGNIVQITSGGSLNASLLGGISGDYGSGNEDLTYSNSSKIYNFLQNTNHRAKIDTGDIRLFEPTSGISNAVSIKSPTSLAAAYSWILPGALPGSGTELVNVNSSGQLDTTASPSVTALTASGAIQGATVEGTTSVETAGYDILHAERLVAVPLVGADITNGSLNYGATVKINATSAACQVRLGVPVYQGQRIKYVYCSIDPDTGGSSALQMDLYRVVSDPGTRTQIGTVSATTSSTAELEISGLTETVNGAWYYVDIQMPNSGNKLFNVYVGVDRV